MKVEAEKLKSITVAGSRTKVVAVGIGSGANRTELYNITSEPQYKNVIFVQDFRSFTDVEEQLANASCSGLLLLVLS